MPACILIAEDNATNLALMVYLLEAFGHRVIGAGDGVEALEHARKEKPDLVLMDLQMPRMDGYQAARTLRADPAFAAVPIVAVTAFAMVGDRDRVLKSGFDGYVAKPIAPETFVGEIEAFLPESLRSGGRRVPPAWSPAESTAAPAPATLARILVVDDLAVNLKLAVASLRPLGYDVLTAAGAHEALQVARERRPDLIVSDLQMPQIGGDELLRLVRSDDRLREIPFLLISSRMESAADREMAMGAGATRYLTRPIEASALVAEIEACLRESRAGKQTA